VTDTVEPRARLLTALRAPAGSETPPSGSYDFSLVLGGPLYQIVRRAHLSGEALELLRRRILVSRYIRPVYVSLDVATRYSMPIGGGRRRSPAGWWFVFVSLPVFQFILLRWYCSHSC
jgi:hypothetical protein